MSLRLTNRRFITALDDLPEMRGLAAYKAGRRSFRDAGGHGGGAGGDDTPPDGLGGGDNADDDSDDDGSDDDEEDDDKKKPKDKGKDDNGDDDEETVPKWKYDKAITRMKAADQTVSSVKKQLDELRNSKDVNADVKRELDEIKAKVTTVEAERDKANERARTLTIQLASLTMKGVPEWANAQTALKLADLSDVDVSDDGKVDTRALKSALVALAKEHPYLVKMADNKNNDSGNESGNNGSKMNGRRKGQRDETSRTALAAKFPVLNR